MGTSDLRQNVAEAWDDLEDAQTGLRRFTRNTEPQSDEAKGLIDAMEDLADGINKLLKKYDNDLSEIAEGLE